VGKIRKAFFLQGYDVKIGTGLMVEDEEGIKGISFNSFSPGETPDQLESGHSTLVRVDGGVVRECNKNTWPSDPPYVSVPSRGPVTLAASNNGYSFRSEMERCLLDADGIRCWGYSLSAYPDGLLHEGLRNPRGIAVGNAFACALDDAGMQCWGNTERALVPDFIPASKNARLIAAGPTDVCIADAQGLMCHGTQAGKTLPSQQALSGIRELKVGKTFVCALTQDDSLECFGSKAVSDWLPARMTGLSHPRDLIAFVADREGACLVVDEGLRCWTSGGADPALIPNGLSLW
jgi:hypothetical protein